jgi:hypothetical protein
MADHDDEHAFTGEPVNELPPDEPRTPGWLPVLGIVLFTLAAVVFLVGRTSSGTASTPDAQGAGEHAAATAPKPASPPAPPTAAPPPAAPPAAAPPATAVHPSREQAGVVKKLVQGAH